MKLIVSTERGHLTRSFSERSCAPGEIVFHDGDFGDTLYLIWSGRVAIIKGDLDSPILLAIRKAGEIFGEMALLENQPRSATVVALDATRLLEIDRAHFERFMNEAPSVSRSIMELLSARLRRLSQERSTGELSEQRLSHQVMVLESEKKRLEESQRMRQETSELIIHDLRNPLGAIAVSLKMLTLMLPEDVLHANQEILAIAQGSCERMQRLVDSLLEVSRLEEGDEPLNLSSVNLPKLAGDVIRRCALLARNGVRIRADLPPNLPDPVIDSDKIERVLMNLVDNSLKYAPENSEIVVGTRMVDGLVRISVTDSGPGIPADERERIFERFSQVAAATPQRLGFGLGLTYCRLAVERHGGQIWAEPGPAGRGSRFVFTLPLKSDVNV
jgi:signal transduction histidine kinase